MSTVLMIILMVLSVYLTSLPGIFHFRSFYLRCFLMYVLSVSYFLDIDPEGNVFTFSSFFGVFFSSVEIQNIRNLFCQTFKLIYMNAICIPSIDVLAKIIL